MSERNKILCLKIGIIFMHTGLSVTIFGEIKKKMVSNFKSTELTYVPRGIGQ
jgi:hypothetical protein